MWRDLFLLPNLISLVRLVAAVPAFLILSIDPAPFWPLLALAGVVIASDFLDGFAARHLSRVSELGKILDPLADKLILAGGVFGLAAAGRLETAIIILLLGKDLVILGGGILLSRRLGSVTPSNQLGKWTSVFLAFGFALCLLTRAADAHWGLAGVLDPLAWLGRITLAAGFVTALLSLAGYGFVAADALRATPLSRLSRGVWLGVAALGGLAFVAAIRSPFLERF